MMLNASLSFLEKGWCLVVKNIEMCMFIVWIMKLQVE